jgi:ubiquitin-like modifier-activating enzyme ATG7
MHGHFAESDKKKKDVSETLDLLDNLVEEHDALFLMTDNRESRWLPTVLGNKYNKIVITVGLRFDSYVIVRHGASCQEYDDKTVEDRLGCYFCNDILSPQNSMRDRTLDQQCTVTRPGLSFISSAYAAELLVSLLHHESGNKAPAADPEAKSNDETCLGILPQYLRGSCADFDSRIFVSKAFQNCVACSEYVLKEFCNNRDEFIFKIMNNPDYVQDVAKITDLLKPNGEEEGECVILEDDFETSSQNKD